MSIRNCPECGRLFDFVYKNMCPDCIKQEDCESDMVIAYLRDNPGAGIPGIGEATGVAAAKILKLLKDGRLIAVCEQYGISLLTCERCGTAIVNGRFCIQCRDSLSKAFSGDSTRGANKSNEKTFTKPSTTKEVEQIRFTEHFKR